MKLDYLCEVLRGVRDLVKKGDIVEINPDKDIDNKTIESGRKIISSIGYKCCPEF